jgi:hypothetical protein
MSEDRAMPPVPEGVFSEEQLAQIGGGGCTPAEWAAIFSQLKDSYETLIDFTSYVIERVAGP